MLKPYIKRLTQADFMAIVGLDTICFPESPGELTIFRLYLT